MSTTASRAALPAIRHCPDHLNPRHGSHTGRVAAIKSERCGAAHQVSLVRLRARSGSRQHAHPRRRQTPRRRRRHETTYRLRAVQVRPCRVPGDGLLYGTSPCRRRRPQAARTDRLPARRPGCRQRNCPRGDRPVYPGEYRPYRRPVGRVACVVPTRQRLRGEPLPRRRAAVPHPGASEARDRDARCRRRRGQRSLLFEARSGEHSRGDLLLQPGAGDRQPGASPEQVLPHAVLRERAHEARRLLHHRRRVGSRPCRPLLRGSAVPVEAHVRLGVAT